MNSIGWASPTDFATGVAPALFVPLALAQEDPSGLSLRPNFTRPDSDVVLCFMILRGQTSPTSIATAVMSLLVVPCTLVEESPASEYTCRVGDSVRKIG